MKQILRVFILLFSLAINRITWGQSLDTLYYDKDWKGCSKSKAEYYRVVTFGKNGVPLGTVWDYYITGELQGEGEAISISKEKDEKSVWKKAVGYFKSGKKSFERSYDSIGRANGTWISWYENGNKEEVLNYANDKLSGECTTYYENGKLKYKREFKEDNPIGNWAIECDEFERCENVFFENFYSELFENNWEINSSEVIEYEITSEQGVLLKKKNSSSIVITKNVPLELSKNFSISTEAIIKVGEIKGGAFGLVYGRLDGNNYHYFYISANGAYRFGMWSDGLNFEFKDWTESKYIKQDNQENTIKVNRVKDKVYYSINGQIVGSADFYPFRGNNLGLRAYGVKSLQIKYIEARQFTVDEDFSSDSKWKGNGTGFFIDCRGYIATNYHVIENESDIEVDLIQNGQKHSYPAKVIFSDKQNDLAVIKIDDSKFKPYSKLPYNLKTQISDVGSSVFALGYPMALSVLGEEVKFTDGKISSKTGFQGDITTYQISVPVQPGNSGGPLFDYDGNIIGVVNAKVMAADNVAYAIKSSYLKNVAEVLPVQLNLPSDISISGKTLVEKIKILSDYVVLIKVK